MTPTSVLICAALLALLLVLAPLMTRRICQVAGLMKPNFRGAIIPACLGTTLLLVACPVYAALFFARISYFAPPMAAAFLLVTTGFGLLGLADDVWGSRTVGGFKGHIKAALMGKPTTGGAKLLGGGLCALGAAFLVNRHFSVAVLADAGVIALGANALNLLDVRPGRAGFGFAVLATAAAIGAVCAVFGGGENAAQSAGGFLLLLPVVLAALREVLPDARAEGMMGDTGSNLLGASAGLACASVLPFWGRVVLLVCLLALNALAERVSLSALIGKTPLLARLDARLGVR